MPTESSFLKAKIAAAADEVHLFPTGVDSPRTVTIDKFLEEHSLTIKKRAASYNAVSGELGLQESNAKTTTLPAAATANQIIAVSSLVAEAKVTTSGGAFIYGKWLTVASATATVVLTQDMTAFFQSDGTNWLLWGEIKDTRTYENKTYTKAEVEAGIEPSATRPASVISETTIESIGGVTLKVPVAANTPFLVSPGQKWKATTAKLNVETSLVLL